VYGGTCLLSRDNNSRRFVFKGVALVEQHPAGPLVKGVFPANLLMGKNYLSNIATKLWIIPPTEKLSESMKFTYAVFEEIDTLCTTTFYENGNDNYALCAFFEAAHSNTVWERIKEIKEILQTYSLRLKGGTGDIIRGLLSLYDEFMKLFSSQK